MKSEQKGKRLKILAASDFHGHDVVSKELAEKAPIHNIILNMVIKHHPNPIQAQEYRIPHIWGGDLESDKANHF